MRLLTFLLVVAMLTACQPRPIPATPAFWEVSGPNGERAWLLGTIHSLEHPVEWQSPTIEKALETADVVVVEIADLGDRKTMSGAFADLSQSRGLPPVERRISAQYREELIRLLDKAGFKPGQLKNTKTWAVALALAQSAGGNLESAYGVDRAVLKAARGKTILELEGATGQLAIFDALPEREQRDLLEAVVRDAGNLETESPGLADAWMAGDMQLIERETRRGLLADPELRAALFTARNEAWKERLVTLMSAGASPFTAVGAAHMAGPEGLPALLEKHGYTVTRNQ